MRTTIEIPDELYRAAKIRAVENQQTLKEFFINSLSSEMTRLSAVKEPGAPYWAHRSLDPEFSELQNGQDVPAGIPSEQLISGERDSREDSVL